MNVLLHLIASERFERSCDQSRMAREAQQRYWERAVPQLQRAIADGDELDQLLYEISRYVSAAETAAYLDGIRDGVGIYCFNGTYENALGDR